MPKWLPFVTSNVPLLAFCGVMSTAFALLNLREGDDFYFRSALETTDWLAFGTNFHATWGGRYAFSFLFPTLIQEQWTWLLRLLLMLSTVLFARSAVLFAECRGAKLNPLQQGLFLGAFFLFYSDTSGSAVLWLTGAFNYFLPMALLLYVIAMVEQTLATERLGTLHAFFCVVCVFFAVSFEQVAIVAIMYLTYISIVHRRSRFQWFFNSLLVAALAGFYLLMSAKGNYIRFDAEMQSSYPDFLHVATSKKIYDAIQLLLESILVLNRKTTALFALVMAFVLSTKNTGRNYQRLAWCLLALILLPVFLPLLTSGLQWHHVYGEPLLSKDTVTHIPFNPVVLGSMIYAAIVGLMFIVVLVQACSDRQEACFLLMLLAAGAASFCAMAFSPTLYASGFRTHYTTNIMVMLVFGIMVSKVRNPRHLMLVAAAMALGFFSFMPLVLEKLTKLFG